MFFHDRHAASVFDLKPGGSVFLHVDLDLGFPRAVKRRPGFSTSGEREGRALLRN